MNSHVTVLEISKSSLLHNLSFFRNRLKEKTKILVVVKAFAYGHEAVEISKILETNKVDYLAVAYLKEGMALRDAGITIPILVLHPHPVNFNQIIKHNLEPALYNNRVLNLFIEYCNQLKLKNYPVHLKFNTGLNRLGFSASQTDSVLSVIKNTNSVKVASFFSHLAASEDAKERTFSINQINIFKEISTKIENSLNYQPLKHMLNTSGIINYPEAQFDMVRLGIGMYGFGNDENITHQLKDVATLKTVISQINAIEKGETVGYNRAFLAKKKNKIATIPIGHADGISRKLGNNVGIVKVNNQKAPIIGNVCMDMLMINVTDIDCKEGDEIIIFDNQKMVEDIATKTNTIAYETLTALSQRIHRKLVD